MAARNLPILPTFTAGQRLLASNLQQITTWGAFWSDAPTFSMHQSIAQTLTNNVETNITLDASDWDSDSGRSGTTPYAFTVPAAWGSGLRWTFSYGIGYQASATGTRWCYLKVNGVVIPATRFQYSGAADPVTINATRSLTLNGGDVVGLWGGQTSGGNLNLNVGNSQSFLEGWLRGTGSP